MSNSFKLKGENGDKLSANEWNNQQHLFKEQLHFYFKGKKKIIYMKGNLRFHTFPFENSVAPAKEYRGYTHKITDHFVGIGNVFSYL